MTDSNVITTWKSFGPQILSITRSIAATMFITNGTMKLFAYPMAMPGGITLELFSQIWFAGVLELFGGSLLLLGLFTRPVAFILSGEMAVAYFQFLAPISFWPIINNGIATVLYCFMWLYISAAGPGPWSLDALRGKQ